MTKLSYQTGFATDRTLITLDSIACYFKLNDTRKVKVLPLPETNKEKSTFRAKALRRELVVGGRGKVVGGGWEAWKQKLLLSSIKALK